MWPEPKKCTGTFFAGSTVHSMRNVTGCACRRWPAPTATTCRRRRECTRLHRDEGLARVGALRVLGREEIRREHDQVERRSAARRARHREVMACGSATTPASSWRRRRPDPPPPCRRSNGRHRYFSTRMRGSINASRMSDSSVPTIGQERVDQQDAAGQVHVLVDQRAQQQRPDIRQVHHRGDDQAARRTGAADTSRSC